MVTPVKHPLEMEGYFGRWCFEAVAAVKAFGLDDSVVSGMNITLPTCSTPVKPLYPAPSSCPRRKGRLLARLFGARMNEPSLVPVPHGIGVAWYWLRC